jgi:alpha-D-xyloside xylohydrolase
MAIVDFTNPAAREWFKAKLRPLVAMGVDCFKTDFGERIPTDVVYHDGAEPGRMHNYYAQLYNQTVFELLEEERGRDEAVLFARSATAGGQRFPVHWGGDCDSTFESMAESLRGGLALGLSGFGFWSHDIGGFEGRPPAELYKRWIAFGLLSSHSRLHGSSSYRVPWLVDEESVAVLRQFTRLKCRLMPYLYGAAVEAHATGIPVMRAMLLEFPDDPAAEQLDRQYMLGERLLVAPVFDAGGEVSYYVPAGRWTHLLSGEAVEGPRWARERHGPLSLPLLVRPNTVLPLGADETRPDYAYADGVTLAAYELADGAPIAVEIPDLSGAVAGRFVVRREGAVVSVEREGAPGAWSLLLVGRRGAAAVRGGAISDDPRGLLVAAEPGAGRLEVTLEGAG